MIKAYYSRLTSEDPKIRAEAGRAWSRWEMATSRIEVDEAYLKRADEPGFADAFARIGTPSLSLSLSLSSSSFSGLRTEDVAAFCTECHYFINAGFFPFDGYLLSPSQIEKIKHIPTTIIQGRYDAVCPAKTAWDLHKAFPEAKFQFVTAGHSSAESEIEKALIQATEGYKNLK